MTTRSKNMGRSWWSAQIEAQAASGLTQTQFCAQQGLALSTFSHWKHRLRDEDEPSHTVVAVRAPSFIEVELPSNSVPVARVILGSVTVEFESVPPPAWVAELAACGGRRC